MSLTINYRISAVFSEHLYTEKVQVQNKIETSVIVVVVWLNLYNDNVIFCKRMRLTQHWKYQKAQHWKQRDTPDRYGFIQIPQHSTWQTVSMRCRMSRNDKNVELAWGGSLGNPGHSVDGACAQHCHVAREALHSHKRHLNDEEPLVNS